MAKRSEWNGFHGILGAGIFHKHGSIKVLTQLSVWLFISFERRDPDEIDTVQYIAYYSGHRTIRTRLLQYMYMRSLTARETNALVWGREHRV